MKIITPSVFEKIVVPNLPQTGWTWRREPCMLNGDGATRQIMSVDGVAMIHIDTANNGSKAIVKVDESLLAARKKNARN